MATYGSEMTKGGIITMPPFAYRPRHDVILSLSKDEP